MRSSGIQTVPGATIIGGLGGSGTRVFAEILLRTGCHIGGNLNSALDYLTFTVLANRPLIGSPTSASLHRVAHLLRREPFRPSDASALTTAALRPGHHAGRRARVRMARQAFRDRGPLVRGAWGFKEPNTARMLPELAAVFDDMRYIHVLRHGLDMALSRNVNQLRSWGSTVGVTWSGATTDRVPQQLAFWLEATRQTHEAGVRLLGDRYLLVRYDDLLENPAGEVSRVARFLGYTGSVDELLSHVRVEGSSGRWLARAATFTDDNRRAVAAWGFDTRS